MFKKTYKIVLIRKSGNRVTIICEGTKKQWRKDIEHAKENYRSYELVGRDGMIVWE